MSFRNLVRVFFFSASLLPTRVEAQPATSPGPATQPVHVIHEAWEPLGPSRNILREPGKPFRILDNAGKALFEIPRAPGADSRTWVGDSGGRIVVTSLIHGVISVEVRDLDGRKLHELKPEPNFQQMLLISEEKLYLTYGYGGGPIEFGSEPPVAYSLQTGKALAFDSKPEPGLDIRCFYHPAWSQIAVLTQVTAASSGPRPGPGGPPGDDMSITLSTYDMKLKKVFGRSLGQGEGHVLWDGIASDSLFVLISAKSPKKRLMVYHPSGNKLLSMTLVLPNNDGFQPDVCGGNIVAWGLSFLIVLDPSSPDNQKTFKIPLAQDYEAMFLGLSVDDHRMAILSREKRPDSNRKSLVRLNLEGQLLAAVPFEMKEINHLKLAEDTGQVVLYGEDRTVLIDIPPSAPRHSSRPASRP